MKIILSSTWFLLLNQLTTAGIVGNMVTGYYFVPSVLNGGATYCSTPKLVAFLLPYTQVKTDPFLDLTVSAFDDGQRLNLPPPPVARKLVKRAVLLAESGRPGAAIADLKKALVISPDYLRAHLEYRKTKAAYLGSSHEYEAQYRYIVGRS